LVEVNKEIQMNRLFAALSIGLLVATPLVGLAVGASSTSESLPPAVDQLMARDMIQLAESNLKLAGFNPGPVDGIFDQQTAAAIREYQAAKGLPVSGLLDNPTRGELLTGFHDASDDSE
jgi:peptidoglycan hydrolase-like protein with peptidoglycan-binding domain